MTVARAAAHSDAGRRRRQNEDAYVCEPPVFCVADGMGGAQAGELASRLAAAAVERSETEGLSGRDRVVALIESANRSVWERAAEDQAASGMGTTMTVAVVEDEAVWIGHVGDSRAYLLRGDRLDQLTQDHSLVAELVRSGRLTPEEAESHPHRSVITRALGTEEDVDVDVFAVEPVPGDLFLLCSDGLTTMVDDDGVLALVKRHRADFPAAARALVEEANRRGGEDNITVVLFELASPEETLEAVPVAPAAREDLEDTLHGVESPYAEQPVADARAGRGVRTGRVLAAAAVAVVVLGALAVYGLSRSHFVGAEENGRVAVYQGLPWELGFGIKLYRLVYESPLLAAQLTQDERRRLFDHDLQSKGAALREIAVYEQDTVP
jgi:protein phosphatase